MISRRNNLIWSAHSDATCVPGITGKRIMMRVPFLGELMSNLEKFVATRNLYCWVHATKPQKCKNENSNILLIISQYTWPNITILICTLILLWYYEEKVYWKEKLTSSVHTQHILWLWSQMYHDYDMIKSINVMYAVYRDLYPGSELHFISW